MRSDIRKVIENICNARVITIETLGGGCISEVRRITLSNDKQIVAKIGDSGENNGFAIEAYMLDYLTKHSALPSPKVIYAKDNLLLMEHIPTKGGTSAKTQEHAAELLAELHSITSDKYGFEKDTLIGGIHQPNNQMDSWIDFFVEHRLLYMANETFDAGKLPLSEMKRIEKFAGKLRKWLDEPEKPSLIHGDMWSGNVLYKNNRIAGFVDPALYYADSEMEFTFSTVYSTFGRPFFERYSEIRPIRAGFFEARRDIYNLFPLLIHALLFGHSYAARVANTLSHFGF